MHKENVLRLARIDLVHGLHEVILGGYYLVAVIALPV
jgi:hypothetical protein